MAAGAPVGAGGTSQIYRGGGWKLLAPSWIIIGIFLLAPVVMMAV